MKSLPKILLSLLAVLLIVFYIAINPRADRPSGRLSRQNFRRGPHSVSHQSIDWVDTTRPTAANGDYKGGDSRRFKGRIWFPTDREGGPYPLLVYSHGFMSQYKEGDYLLDFLASHGFVAVSANFPLSNGGAPGGAVVSDTPSQAGDIAFLIDQMLARSKQPANLLFGRVDPDRIAVLGLSLGGLTTELAAFSPTLKDPRIRAAISMAGPSQFLTPEFFEGDTIPLLYIGGTADAIVPFPQNAEPIPWKYKNSVLVALDWGSHIGFAGIATFFRWLDNPDKLACVAVMHALKKEREESKTGTLPNLGQLIGGPGVDVNGVSAPCQAGDYPKAMRPARQHTLVTLAAYSFLESQFSPSEARRQEMHEYLFHELAKENPDVRVSSGE